MPREIRLISTDFDGTLVAHHLNGEGGHDSPIDADCMRLIGELQSRGVVWAINTGRSRELLESGLTTFRFPVRPDFILTSERDVFRPAKDGKSWEPYGDWNTQVARDHQTLYTSAASVYAEVLDFVAQNTSAQVIRETHGPEGLIAESEEEMERIIAFIDEARAAHPHFHYQHNTVFLRFCHTDYHKGAALAELARLLETPKEQIFAAGDHYNDLSMLDGRYASMPACPSNAIDAVKEIVRTAGGFVAGRPFGAGVFDALKFFAVEAETATTGLQETAR